MVVLVGLLIVETVTGVVPLITVNVLPAAIAVAKSSLYVRVKVVPLAAKLGLAIKLKTGPVLSTVELFVTACALNETTLFPRTSCSALSPVELSTPGEAYATVTILPAPKTGEKFRIAWLFTIETLDGTTATPSTSTVNEEVDAVVCPRSSLNVKVNVDPVAKIVGTGLVRIGPLVSTEELFVVTSVKAKDAASKPSMPCTAELESV